MIIFEENLTIFRLNANFWYSWGSIGNWLEPKAESPSVNLACQNQQNDLYIYEQFNFSYLFDQIYCVVIF